MRKIIYTMDRLEGNPALPDLLRDAVRPSLAVAPERIQEAEALQPAPVSENGKSRSPRH